jgi:hypothetical protein
MIAVDRPSERGDYYVQAPSVHTLKPLKPNATVIVQYITILHLPSIANGAHTERRRRCIGGEIVHSITGTIVDP